MGRKSQKQLQAEAAGQTVAKQQVEEKVSAESADKEQTEALVNTAAKQEYAAVLAEAQDQDASAETPEYISLSQIRGLSDITEPSEEERMLPQQFMQQLEHYSYFDCDNIRRDLKIAGTTLDQAFSLCEKGDIRLDDMDHGYSDYSDGQVIEVRGTGFEGKNLFQVNLVFDREEAIYTHCSCSQCRRYYGGYYGRKLNCRYIAALLELTQRKLRDKAIGDATDYEGTRLIHAFVNKRARQVYTRLADMGESLSLVPKLVKKAGELNLTFKVGREKLYVVKNLFDFQKAVQSSSAMTFGSNTELNLAPQNFRAESAGWLSFLERIIQEEKAFEQRLEDSGTYYTSKALSRRGQLSLYGWRLDDFYEMLQEEELEYEDRDISGEAEKKKKRTGKNTLHRRDKNPKIVLHIEDSELNTMSTFHGIQVYGDVPVIFQGIRNGYFIEDNTLCRMEEHFMEQLKPLLALSNEGAFNFQIGRSMLSEFYYSVLPQLRGVAEIVEEVPEVEKYLPPQAEFVFYLDAENQNFLCRLHAVYGGQEVNVLDWMKEDMQPEAYREAAREQETLVLTRQWFPQWDQTSDTLHCGADEETMYRVLEQGMDALLSMGEVRCTRRFGNIRLERRVKVSVGVSVSNGLLELDVSTEDLTPQELLDILQSYRSRQKYYRLKNGDFLNLQDDSIGMLDEMMAALRLSPKEVLKGNLHLPMYRALYLDKLLEEREDVISNRDTHFREMVKGFKTVKDADFEVPAGLKKVMRSYQKMGYRWLRMLEAYQFGGILADDMGLGKTLQVIAVLLAAKQEGKTGTSLVVTPASLVFNWGEEISRFAPGLKYQLVTGTQEERRQKLEQAEEYDVLVTSYDLLKRDVEHYEKLEFTYQIIDEAQYIKNHTTAASKAVKVINSQTRYALTGTPIENRLSELWSIFDYLMPGFLYGYEAFKKEFETPIVKYEDGDAMNRMRRMVAPFILRRLKEDVLKDLPEKLEEARFVKFETSQQHLYDAQVTHMRQKLAMQGGEEFQKHKMEVLAELMRLRQICCDPRLCFDNYQGESAKLDSCMELVKSAVDGGHKVLLFSQFTTMLGLFEQQLEQEGISYYMITGSTPKEKRLQLVKSFNEDDTKVFLISLKAGGVGLNLTGADVVIHYDPWWNLAVQNQATDRAHRIGQTRRVTVFKLIAKGTIEEKIAKLQETKKELSDQIIQGDANQLSRMTKEDFLELL